LSSARALKVFLFVLGVVAVALSFAHVGPPAHITIWTLILLLGAFVLIRAVPAAREAKRYRRHRSAADLQHE
jgi:membrane protein YdbS with pleckstrin-like domain